MIRALQLRPLFRGNDLNHRYYIFVSNRFPNLTSFQGYRNFVSSDTATRNLDRLPCAAKREKKNTTEYVFPPKNSQTIVHHSSASGKIPFFFRLIPRLLQNFIYKRKKAKKRVEFDRSPSSINARAGKFNETVIIRYADPPSIPRIPSA